MTLAEILAIPDNEEGRRKLRELAGKWLTPEPWLHKLVLTGFDQTKYVCVRCGADWLGCDQACERAACQYVHLLEQQLADALAERDKAVDEARKQGEQEGAASQAILEIQARKRFLDTMKLLSTEKDDTIIALKAEQDRLYDWAIKTLKKLEKIRER